MGIVLRDEQEINPERSSSSKKKESLAKREVHFSYTSWGARGPPHDD